MARENEKVVGTRLSEVDQEALEKLAVFHDKTVGALLRTAVREFIEKEQRNIHPLSLEAAVCLASSLGIDTSNIFNSACHLTNASLGNIGGVYLLVHQETRELYVGSSLELTARLTHHKFSIKTGTHKNAAVNGWCLDDVVVVILESCESKKDAATKRALLEREQHYIDTLKLAKDWTVLNLVVASRELPKETTAPTKRSKETTVVKETPQTTVKVVGVKTPTAFETFYSNCIEQELIPVLDEQTNSRDVVRLFEGCRDEQEKRWFLEFLGSYNSSWLNGLASTGKFPWIANLLELVKTTPANTNF